VIFLVAAVVALAAPMTAFLLAPFILGPLHVAAGAVRLAPTQRSPWRFWFGFGVSAALFATLEAWGAGALSAPAIARAELFVGFGWALTSAAIDLHRGATPRPTPRVALACAAAWGLYAAAAWAAPSAFLALLVAAHNAVSIGLGLRVSHLARPRAATRLDPSRLATEGLLAVGFLLVITAAPVAPGADTVAAALGVGRRAALGLLYLQLAHYVVWLRMLRRDPGAPRTERFSLISPWLVAPLVLGGGAMAALAPRWGGIAAVRASYLAVAGFHVLAELVAITGISLAGRTDRVAGGHHADRWAEVLA
jgi:hypothetical protein